MMRLVDILRISAASAALWALPTLAAADVQDPPPADEPASAKKADAAPNSETGFQRVEERSPRAGTPLIQNKLYPMGFRLELTGFFDYSFNDKYVEHLGGHGALGLHIFDWLAVEGFGGYLVGDETGITKNARTSGNSHKRAEASQPCANATCEPQLPDLWQTTWFAGADVQWAPIYGKLSVVSEVDLSFQLYGIAGGGVEGIRKLTNNPGVYEDGGLRFSANYGIGLRVIPWKYVALRAELRNYNGLNPNVAEHDKDDEEKCTNGYVLTSGTDKQCNWDISQNTMLQVGVSFLW